MDPSDILSGDESLFTSPGTLDMDYLPKLLPFREHQQKYLASCMERLPPVGSNVLIWGPPGIGKSACMKWVFRELRESGNDETVPVYINCWKDSSVNRIAQTLCSHFGIETYYKSPEEMFDSALRKLKSLTSLALALDEVDRLQDSSILYTLSEEIPRKIIIMMTNSREWFASLDNRIRSRLMPEALEFRAYDIHETKGILEERKRAAFSHGVWDANAFDMVVGRTFAAKDIRTGLALLKTSGLAAEDEASRKITAEHVRKAIEKLQLEQADSEIQGKTLADFGQENGESV